MSEENRPNGVKWLWPYIETSFEKTRILGQILGFLIFILGLYFAITFLGILDNLFAAAFNLGPYEGKPTDEAIRNIGLVIVAAIGAPFVAWRSWTAKRQADVAQQGHITDQINTAVQGLGAEKNVRRQRTNKKGIPLYDTDRAGQLDYKNPIFHEITEPNLEVRIGSIYALERVAKESASDRAQILEILVTYVNNNSHKADEFPYPPLVRFNTDEDDSEIAKRFDPFNQESTRAWAQKLKRPRPDTQAAISVINRCVERFSGQKSAFVTSSMKFTGANLQKVDFAGVNLCEATFEECQLDGANFQGSDLTGVRFKFCSLIGAQLDNAVLTRTDFFCCNFEGGSATNIHHMEGCHFFSSECSGSSFSGSDLSDARFSVTARKADFRVEKMDNTSFSMCDIRDGNISAFSMNGLHIFSSWVPQSGVQLLERVDHGNGGISAQVKQKVRLFAHPSSPNSVYSERPFRFDDETVEIDQGDVELFDPKPAPQVTHTTVIRIGATEQDPRKG